MLAKLEKCYYLRSVALIFDIKRYAIHDGPGIRTTVFLKGCQLRCVWCHNPESWLPGVQRIYKKSRCIGCLSCVEACPQGVLEMTPEGIRATGNACTLCGSCAQACPSLAMEMCGRQWSVPELMETIEKERSVMEEGGGGVTLSGGEPLMHPEFTLELLRELGRRGFHRTVDTTLFASAGTVREAASLTDLFLVDLKVFDSEAHRRWTGVPNTRILENLRLVSSLGVPFRIRIPLIEGVNASTENIRATAAFLSSLPNRPEQVDLLPYHDIGKGKHERLGTLYNPESLKMGPPDSASIERCSRQLEAAGCKVTVGG